MKISKPKKKRKINDGSDITIKIEGNLEPIPLKKSQSECIFLINIDIY